MIGGLDSNNHSHHTDYHGGKEERLSLFQPPSPPMSSPSSILTNFSKRAAYLPEGYVPGPYDVICQRGKDCHEHVGNRRFRVVVEEFVDHYLHAKTRQEKSKVISNIVNTINESAGQGQRGFIMKDPRAERWHHVDSKVARDKVGNALRDAAKQREDSSNSKPGMEKRSSFTSTSHSQQPSPMTGTSSFHTPMVEDELFMDHEEMIGYIDHESSFSNHLADHQPMHTSSSSSTSLYQHGEQTTIQQMHKRIDHFLRAPRFSASHEPEYQGTQVQHQQFHRNQIHPSCFSMSTNSMVEDQQEHQQRPQHADFSSHFPLEALAQSMDIIDDLADLEPRPIENMLRRS